MAKVVAIDKEMFVAEVDELKQLIDAINKQKGSNAERVRNATHEALGQEVSFTVNDMPSAPDIVEGTGDDGTALVNLGDLATFVKSLGEWAEQMANEAVTMILKSSTDGSRLDVLKAEYTSKKEFVDSLVTVLTTLKIDVSDVVIPQLRGLKSAGSTRSTTKNSQGQWYRVVKGVRKEQSDSQNSISAYAFWHGASLMGIRGEEGTTNDGKGVPTSVLEKFLTDNVTDSPLGKSWSHVQGDVTYGMDVIPQNAPKSDEDKSDEEE